MGFWATLRASRRKNAGLKRISKILGGDTHLSIASTFFEATSAREAAENELYDLIEADPALNAILHEHSADRDSLKRAYRNLLFCGAGQWAKGHYVAVSAIAFGTTLPFVLTALKNSDGSVREVWTAVAYRLVTYFENGEVRRI